MEPLRRSVVRAGTAMALLAALVLGTGPWPAAAQGVVATEYAVKAAFLYHFAKFVQWPEASGATSPDVVQLCVLGDDPFGRALDDLSERGADGLRVRVRHVTAIGAEPRCHIVFISASERGRLGRHLASAAAHSVLSVSDMDGFVRAGGVIQFVIESGKVRFWINRDAAADAHLRLSSRLLALARFVEPAATPDP